MKKILVAACLIFSTAAFTQNQQINNNSHGQNDCQCIGIGIPTPHGKGTFSDVVPGTIMPDKKKETNINSWWYAYVQIYLNAIHNRTYIVKQK